MSRHHRRHRAGALAVWKYTIRRRYPRAARTIKR